MSSQISFKGRTPDERLNNAEVIINRMQRRLHKAVYTITPPTPYSTFVSGVEVGSKVPILAYLFPFEGVLSGLKFYVEDPKVVSVSIEFHFVHPSKSVKYSFTVKQGLTSLDFEEQIMPGSRLTSIVADAVIKGKPDVVQTIDNIWIAFLCDISRADSKVEQFLIENLLKGVEVDVE